MTTDIGLGPPAASSPTTVGDALTRHEDDALLRGAAEFTGDLETPGMRYVAFVRSRVAHGQIRAVRVTRAMARPGVVTVLTSADLDLPKLAATPATLPVNPAMHRPLLAGDRVRFVGETVAVVVATSASAARAGAALVQVEVEELDTVPTTEDALAASSPLLFKETSSNICIETLLETGDPDLEGPIEVTVRVRQPRMGVMPMEPAAILVIPDHAGNIEVVASTQMPHRSRQMISALLDIPLDNLRVRCPAVGGGFGGKTPFDADYLLAIAVARHLEVPLRWAQTRHENLLTMQGRGYSFDVRVIANSDGKVLGVDVDAVGDVGAYPGVGVSPIHTARGLFTGTYDIPNLRARIRCVVTNTAPTGALRGAGRPEGIHVIERAMDELAHRLQLDPAEIRRRNFVKPDQFPYTNAGGETYDTGDYPQALEVALRAADYPALRREQAAQARSAQSILGIGISSYVEVSANPKIGLATEGARVILRPGGKVELRVGTSAHGQGHWTMYSQVASAVLGIPPGHFTLAPADTGLTSFGEGTGGSRSAQIGGSAVHLAAADLLQQAHALIAGRAGCGTDEIRRDDAQFVVPNGDRYSWADVAGWAGPGSLSSEQHFDQGTGTAPFGCHVAVVQVDTQTGRVQIRQFLAVDDCGTVINPLIVTGQVHGGVGTGIAEALFEQITFDPAGVPTSATLAEYLMPSAADLASITVMHTTTPTPLNPLGAKGIGESGTTGSLAAVHNAVIDALRTVGAGSVEIPATPERVWRALRARVAAAARP